MMPLLLSDGYKHGHPNLYPSNMEYLYSNTTPRSSRIDGVNEVVVFGISYFVQEYLNNIWRDFFSTPVENSIAEYREIIDNHIGPEVVNEEKIRYLHSLGYLPIRLKALPEGTLCPIGVPLMTITNTDPKCGWLTNFLETISQTILWRPMTSATIAHRYKKLLTEYAVETSDSPLDFVNFQAHDFSMRGMDSLEAACTSGAAHLTSFWGTDSVPAIKFLMNHYGANPKKEMVGASVTATEHSIQCTYKIQGVDNEHAYIQAMLDRCPKGIISIVADGYDFFKFISEDLPHFKDQIMAREGKVVVRPDSGNPVKIICGYTAIRTSLTFDEVIQRTKSQSGYMQIWDGNECLYTSDGRYVTQDGEISELEAKGAMIILKDVFGGTMNSKGYFELDPHIGLIYGDSITYERCEAICETLMNMDFASTNCVYGIGSYTYTYNTRDTFGFACKATANVIDGKSNAIFKQPKTDKGGMKKSAKGYLQVHEQNGRLVLQNDCPNDEGGLLQTVFENGQHLVRPSLTEIRERLANETQKYNH